MSVENDGWTVLIQVVALTGVVENDTTGTVIRMGNSIDKKEKHDLWRAIDIVRRTHRRTEGPKFPQCIPNLVPNATGQ
jgi:hypothetical protein